MLTENRLNRVIWTAKACTLALLAGLSASGRASAQQQELLEWPCDVVPVGTDVESDRGPVVSGISLQPHGQLLAIVGDDSLVRLSDRDTGKQLFVLEGHHEWVRCVQFSVDGQYLFTAGNDRRILKWDTKTGEMVGEVAIAPFAVYAMQVNPRTGKLAIAGFSRDILVFDPEQPALKTVIQGSCADIRVVRFSANGMQLAAAGRDGWVRIWDLQNYNLTYEVKAHQRRVRDLQFSADGRQLVSCGEDLRIRINNLADDSQSRELNCHPCKVYAVQLLEGDLLASAGSDNDVHIWDLKQERQVGRLVGHEGSITSLEYDGSRLYSTGFDTFIRIWRTNANFAKVPDRDPNRISR